jgi:hypothetical protein
MHECQNYHCPFCEALESHKNPTFDIVKKKKHTKKNYIAFAPTSRLHAELVHFSIENYSLDRADAVSLFFPHIFGGHVWMRLAGDNSSFKFYTLCHTRCSLLFFLLACKARCNARKKKRVFSYS